MTDDFWKLHRDLVDDLVPHDYPISHSVTLRDIRQQLSGPSIGQLKRVSSNTSDPGPGKNGDFSTNLVITSPI